MKMKPRTAPWMITWWALAVVCLFFTTIVTGFGRLALFFVAAILVGVAIWPTRGKGFG